MAYNQNYWKSQYYYNHTGSGINVMNMYSNKVQPIIIHKGEIKNKQRKDMKTSETKSSGFYKYFYEAFVDCCQTGTLHGFKYIVKANIARTEKIFWIIVCLLSIAICTILIGKYATSWYSSPFNIVLDDMYTPVFDIPFPSVVICPNSPIKKSLLRITNITNRSEYFATSLVCSHIKERTIPMEERIPAAFDTNIVNFLSQKAPSCKDTLKICTWAPQDEESPDSFDCCSELFQPVFTSKGLCFGFNMLTRLSKSKLKELKQNTSIDLWNVHSGYSALNSSATNQYPRVAFEGGQGFGLYVELFMNTSETQSSCDGSQYGFQILINNPTESPTMGSYFPVSMDKSTMFAIMPDKIRTHGDIKEWKYNDRKCYFENERKLNYFSYYSQMNCMSECEIGHMIKICGCVQFSVKSLVPHIPLCSSNGDVICSQKVKRHIKSYTIDMYFQEKDTSSSKKFANDVYVNGIKIEWCHCWQSCDDISYNLEVSSSNIFYKNISQFPPWAESPTSKYEVTRISLYYKDEVFIGKNRQMRYTRLDFVASCGGLLSLFLGFSIISLFEVGVMFIKPILIIFFKIILKWKRRTKIIVGPFQPYVH